MRLKRRLGWTYFAVVDGASGDGEECAGYAEACREETWGAEVSVDVGEHDGEKVRTGGGRTLWLWGLTEGNERLVDLMSA